MPRRFHHGLTDSTNERALEAVAAGRARDGDVHLAEAQTAGRGRRGRGWSSPAGEGLYASVVLRFAPPAPPPAGITIAAGLAARDAVVALGLGQAVLKWPNDLLVRGAKLAGLLVEARGLDPARPTYVVGLGCNVLQRRFPAELERERPVTSLAREGLVTSPAALLEAWLAALEQRRAQLVGEPGGLCADYLGATGLAQRAVRVRTGREACEGRLVGLDLEGGLSLATGDATRRLALAHVAAVEELGRSAGPAPL